MIGAVSAVGSYTGIQRYSQVNPAAMHGAPSLDSASSVVAVHKSSGLETPVQPVTDVKAVNPGASGNLNVDLTARNDVEATEMSVRMRMTSADPKAAQTEELSPWAEMETKDAQKEEKLQEEQEAEEKREAYLEELKEKEEARVERIEALKEAQAEEKTDGSEAEEGDRKAGLQLDHTVAMLQNFQMNNLMNDMLSARVNGEDTTGYSAVLDALLQNGQERVQFTNGEAEASDTRRYYQQKVSASNPVFGAAA